MAMLDKHPSTEPRTQCLSATYWHARIESSLEQLETEARRMLQLEHDLSEFATHYYTAIGEAAERLAQLESFAPNPTHAHPEFVAAMPEMLSQRDAPQQRRSELKTRYRNLAKEVHPDRTLLVEGTGSSTMHSLNHAYQQGDLAALLRLEAQMELRRLMQASDTETTALEHALREVARAAETYAEGYRTLLHSPLNELMLRAMSARLAGWDWTQAVVRKMERSIEEKQRALALAHIAEIGAWRTAAHPAA